MSATVTKATVEVESLATMKIEAFRGDSFITSATGFFYKNDKAFGIVSNWHVFSGRNPYTGQPLDQKTGRTPDRIRTTYYDPQSKQYFNAEFDAGCDSGSAKWLQHPLGQRIDIAALRLPTPPSTATPINGTPPKDASNEPILQVSNDVFIVGYPKGLQKQGTLPVWKRGTIASEPDIPIENLPMILVDSVTRDGMSGAPVFFAGSTFETSSAPGATRTWKIGAPIRRFIGIYSGRYGADDPIEQLHLARVWKKEAVDEVLYRGVPGNFVICL